MLLANCADASAIAFFFAILISPANPIAEARKYLSLVIYSGPEQGTIISTSSVLGVVFLLQETPNNPAQAKLYTNVAASGMALYNINWKRCPITLRYQVDVPVMGVMFSPEYGQSYYEIFSLGHTEGTVHFTSLHNQPTMRHWLTADVNFRKLTLRVGYMADMQQTSVGGLKSHDYSSSFMVGFVKNLRIID